MDKKTIVCTIEVDPQWSIPEENLQCILNQILNSVLDFKVKIKFMTGFNSSSSYISQTYYKEYDDVTIHVVSS